MSSETPYIKVTEVAAMLQVTPKFVYDEIRAGRLPAVRLGHPDCGPLRILRADVRNYLLDRKTTASA